MKTFLLSGLAALLLLAGCASPQSRIKKNRAAFDTYPADVQAAIQRGEVLVGFTPEQTRIALGEPDRILTRTTAEGSSEIWVYRDSKPRLGLGLGLGLGGGGGTSVGTGVGVSTGGREFPDERLRLTLAAGRVAAIEQVGR